MFGRDITLGQTIERDTPLYGRETVTVTRIEADRTHVRINGIWDIPKNSDRHGWR